MKTNACNCLADLFCPSLQLPYEGQYSVAIERLHVVSYHMKGKIEQLATYFLFVLCKWQHMGLIITIDRQQIHFVSILVCDSDLLKMKLQ